MKCSQNRSRHFQKNRRKRERQQKKQQQHKKLRNRGKEEGRNLVFRLHKTILHHFPDLFDRFREIPDCRKEPDYSLMEILGAGLMLFVFKKGSRHAMNNERDEPVFRQNYERLFQARLPHMDTVDAVLCVLEETHLECLKAELVKGLVAKKVVRKYRVGGGYYRVAIDGTHVMTVREGHCEHCLHRTLSNGEVMYFHTVLEAKLVCPNGFCLSLATEWIENPAEYDKQDCELKGFKRLAQKLKQFYPRLPLCLVADGLYPNEPFFQICQDKGWHWIVTFQAGNLPRVWSQVILRQGLERCRSRWWEIERRGQAIRQWYEWLVGLTYQGFALHWFTCTEVAEDEVTEFTYLSSLAVDYQQVIEFTDTGRLRWKIENEGFDVQKHHGYGLGHQFSRTSMPAMKNYYQLMQIAHLLNQLFEFGSLLMAVRRRKESLSHVWLCVLGELRHAVLNFAVLAALSAKRIQLRYD